MTFILITIPDGSKNLQLSNRRWRPVAAEIIRAKIVTDERIHTLDHHLCTPVHAAEARTISKHLSKLIETNTLPDDIDDETALAVAKFAAASSDFEVC